MLDLMRVNVRNAVGAGDALRSKKPWAVAACFLLSAFLVGTARGNLQAQGANAAGVGAGPAPASPAVRFSLDMAEGRPGESVSLHLTVSSETELKSISVAINFNARLLRAENVLRTPALEPQPPRNDVLQVRIDNQEEDAIPTNSSMNGWIYLRLDAGQSPAALAPGAGPLIFEIQFLILGRGTDDPNLRVVTPVIFEDVGPVDVAGNEQDLKNAVEVLAGDHPEERDVPPEDLDDGGVVILGIGEVGFFRRADANHDCEVDAGDCLFTINFLFRSSGPPPCEDAADANDDGYLNIADAVFTLRWLFAGGSAPPYPLDFGSDPTEDRLGCKLHYGDPCGRAEERADT